MSAANQTSTLMTMKDLLPAKERAPVTGSGRARFSCPRCGWRLDHSSEACGNATCPAGRRARR